MEKNLFQQAKEMVAQMTGGNNTDNLHQDEDKEAVIKAIQSAYQGATPEEQEQLTQFEQDINKKLM